MDESVNLAVDFELIEPLSERELDILALIAEQRTNQEIADALFLSLNTVKWYARQIYGKLAVANRREAVERASQLGLLGEPEQVAASRTHNLPAQLTPFVGRQKDLVELRRLLFDPSCRILTVTGPGGMGKTRLALEAANQIVQDARTPFGDGIFLASLASLSKASPVAPTIADAVGFRLYQAENTHEQQLCQFLGRKHVLLVLDNFEHLISQESLRFLIDLLAAASGVTVLATSRVRLNIQGEQVYPLSGLDVPKATGDLESDVAEIDGIKLFTEAVQRANPAFVLNQTNFSSVIDICRLVEGMPLAIELAAAWAVVLEPLHILSEIRNSLDFLATDASNVPTRQRSLMGMMDASWQFLNEAERVGMSRLSIFRDGFTIDAALHVAEVLPKTLLGLVGKSWLQRNEGGRFHIHEMLRQYSVVKLKRDPTQETAIRTKHSQYFCQLLSSLDDGLKKRNQEASLKTIAMELENMLSACFWAASHGLFDQLDMAVYTLGRYYECQDGFLVANPLFEQLAQELIGVKDETGQHALAQILVWRCSFRNWVGDTEASKRLADAALALIHSPTLAERDMRPLQAHIALTLGYAHFRTHAPLDAQQYFNHSYELNEQINDKIGMADALVGLGRTCRIMCRFKESETLIRRGTKLHEIEGNQLGLCDALMALGDAVFRQQRFDEAERLFKRSLSDAFSTDQVTVDQVLLRLSKVYHESGRFAEATSMIDQCLSLRRDRSLPWLIAVTEEYGGAMYRDLGNYEKSRELGEDALALAQASRIEPIIGYALVLLGSIDLLEGDIQQAYQLSQEGAALLPKKGAWETMGFQAWLGIAARTLGKWDEAWRHVQAELVRALHAQRYLVLLTSLAGLILLLVDAEEVERAVELHALLLEHPYTANAYWFSTMVTPTVMAAAAELSMEQREADEARGRASDLWAVAAKLTESRADG